jgi:hypothetical protein
MSVKPSSVLDDIVAAYQLERDVLKIAKGAIGAADLTLLAGTSFIGRSVRASQSELASLQLRLDEMAVLAMWIEFERFVIGHIMSQLNIVGTAPAPFDSKLTTHVERQIEFSKFDDILDLYKGWVDSNLIGQVKQIKSYRDWISHRNPKRPTPAAVLPINARAILGTVMDGIT